MTISVEYRPPFSSWMESPTKPAPAPVARIERLPSLDILRGFALLGIFVANIDSFAAPVARGHILPPGALEGWHAQLDLVILIVKWMFVEGKMRALFSALFGAGVILLTERIEQRANPAQAADIYLRRNMWLALFGLIHGMLIWYGDVLFIYAVVALLFLYPFRHVRPSRLAAAGLAVWLILGSASMSNMFNIPAVMAKESRLQQAEAARQAGRPLTAAQGTALADEARTVAGEPARIAAEIRNGHRGYLDSVADNATEDLDFVVLLFRSGRVAETIGAMLLGMALFKLGFFPGTLPTRAYLTAAIAGYAIAWPIVLTGIAHCVADGFRWPTVINWIERPFMIQQVAGMIANASVILLLIRARWPRPLLNALGAVGRTAFSNYILTSLICKFLYNWGPWALYGRMDYHQQLYVIAGIWTFNIVASLLWLRFFAFGPLEWVWRSLTYWRRQPFRRTAGGGE